MTVQRISHRNKTQNLKDLAHERKLAKATAAHNKKILAQIDKEERAKNRIIDRKNKKEMKELEKFNQ